MIYGVSKVYIVNCLIRIQPIYMYDLFLQHGYVQSELLLYVKVFLQRILF